MADKKRAKLLGGVEPFNRIKKDLLKLVRGQHSVLPSCGCPTHVLHSERQLWTAVQMKTLTPQDRVLLLGNARDPTMCVKRDADALKALFPTRILTPLPTPASRMVSWRPCSTAAGVGCLPPALHTPCLRQPPEKGVHQGCQSWQPRLALPVLTGLMRQVIWSGLVQQLTGRPAARLDVSSLSHLSGSYAPGTMRKVGPRVRRIQQAHTELQFCLGGCSMCSLAEHASAQQQGAPAALHAVLAC